MKRVMFYISALPLLAFASSASAVTCDEVEWGSEITAQFPDVARSCRDVVERDGAVYGKNESATGTFTEW